MTSPLVTVSVRLKYLILLSFLHQTDRQSLQILLFYFKIHLSAALIETFAHMICFRTSFKITYDCSIIFPTSFALFSYSIVTLPIFFLQSATHYFIKTFTFTLQFTGYFMKALRCNGFVAGPNSTEFLLCYFLIIHYFERPAPKCPPH